MRTIKHIIGWALLIMLVLTGCASIEKAESLHLQGEKQEALEMAISLLEDDSSKVRLRAVKLIGKIGGSDAGAALHQRLSESDDRVRRDVFARRSTGADPRFDGRSHDQRQGGCLEPDARGTQETRRRRLERQAVCGCENADAR